MDRLVVEPLGAQLVDRLGRVCGRRVRQREREVAERPLPRRQVRAAVVVRGVLGPVCGALVTEVVGVLAEEYEAAIGRAGKVFNIVRAMSLRPGVLRASMALYREIMFGPSGLSRQERELLAVVVSNANACVY